MRVVITGTRAPASMDIIRSLIKQGHEVYSADSLRYPLGRFVKGIKAHFTLPKPSRQLDDFIKALKIIILDHQIDLLIPTCEEIFFISQGYDELSKHCRLFCEPFARLNSLHNKFIFNRLVHDYGLDAPESWLLSEEADKSQLPLDEELILKPVYSRFGSQLIVKPIARDIEALNLKVPYVAQRFIQGKEYCAYAIAQQGRVLLQTAYHPKYTSGPAAGIYFEPVKLEALSQFVERFCANYQFSGQIAFDFIVVGDRAFVLECNPRVTSGFHLVAEAINWSSLLAGELQVYVEREQPRMLGLAMKLYGRQAFLANPRVFIQDYQRAQDVLKDEAYPWISLKSLLTMTNIALRMFKEKKNFHRASTDDIEFNGEGMYEF